MYRVQDQSLKDHDQTMADGTQIMTLGNTTTDGMDVLLQVDVGRGGSMAEQGSHEMVHGDQFLQGRLEFGLASDGKWYSNGNTYQTEYEGFAGQSTKPAWWNSDNSAANERYIRAAYPNLNDGAKPLQLYNAINFNERLVRRTAVYFAVWPPKQR
jgi:hypothetical protein